MQVNKLLVVIGSIIEICLGIVHFVTIQAVVPAGGFEQLAPSSLDLFKLAMLCVGLLLIFAGAVSLMTIKLYDENRKYFVAICRIQFLLWAFRFYLEGQFPIKVPMLFLKEPTQIISLTAFILCLLFLIASFYKKKELEK